MSRIKKTKHKRIKFLQVILSLVIICALLFFIYSKLKSNDSKSYSTANTTNSTTDNNTSNNKTVNEVNTSNGNNVKVSTGNIANGNNITPNKTVTSNSSTSNKTSTGNTATNKTNYVVELPTNAESSKGNEITVDNATKLLTNKLIGKDSKIKISYDHTQNKNNINYYVFQSFDSQGTSSTSDNHSDTLGWYYVNVATGDLFTYDLNNDVLNPLK